MLMLSEEKGYPNLEIAFKIFLLSDKGKARCCDRLTYAAAALVGNVQLDLLVQLGEFFCKDFLPSSSFPNLVAYK